MKYPDVLMVEMKLRGLSARTIEAYTNWNNRFRKFVNKNPLAVTQRDIDTFLLQLADNGLERSTRHLAVAALRFYYTTILKRKFCWKYPRLRQKLPTVLTREEIEHMLSMMPNLKHKLLIELMYASGLRVSEAVKLKVTDLDLSEGMLLIRDGKGGKDRYGILSKRFMNDLQAYLQKRKDNSLYLFPSQMIRSHISTRTAASIVKHVAQKAGIQKRVYCHALRASFATHLLQNGTSLFHIQKLMGHSRLSTTQSYTPLSTQDIQTVQSPLDHQPCQNAQK